MNTLYNILGDDLKIVLESCEDIKFLDDNEIEDKINFLKNVNCSTQQIKNIIMYNPWFLNRSLNEIKKLKDKLISIGITNLNITFDTNPLILNKEVFEIEDFINLKIKEGLDISNIIDLIDGGVQW